jgi:DNA-binding NtrC family response regulator
MLTLAALTTEALRELLERHDWNLASAARAVGVHQNKLRWRMHRAGLRREYDSKRITGPRLGAR